MQAMVGSSVSEIDQRVGAIEELDLAIRIRKGTEVGIVLPEGLGRGANVGQEFSRVPVMEVANRGGQHDNIAGGQTAPENKLPGSHRLGRPLPFTNVSLQHWPACPLNVLSGRFNPWEEAVPGSEWGYGGLRWGWARFHPRRTAFAGTEPSGAQDAG